MHPPDPHHAPHTAPEDASLEGLAVRTWETSDQQAVLRLYDTGLLAGQIAANDTGADVDNIHEAYLDQPRHHFWVAEHRGQVVGMIAVASDEDDTAEVRRLRIDVGYQATRLAAILVRTALQHCRRHGYLKVRLDTRYEPTEAIHAFEQAGFQHTRTRTAVGKDMLEFYLDLYRDVHDNT